MGEARTSHSSAGREDADRFRLMFERSADAILLLDTGTNFFVEYNQASLDMLRCTPSELSALHPSALSPPRQPDGSDSFQRANEMIAIAIRDGSNRFEWVHRSPKRDDFPVEVLLTALSRDASPMLLVVWRDITERRQREEALRQAQRLESVGVLAGGVAHDFNNLLTAVTGHLELARLNLGDPERARQHLDTIERAVKRGADLTRKMLAYAGGGQTFVEPLELGSLIDDLLELLRVSVSPHIRIASERPSGAFVVEADRGQAQQVVMNLFTNAAEAIGDNPGSITMRLRQATLDAETVSRDFAGQNVQPGEKVVLSVSDTGHGMSPEVVARIFDPFFSTKQPGRGLGLSALRGILRSHRAGLRLESRVAQGTTFEVFFSTSTATTSVPAQPAPRPIARAATGTVLLVDDEHNVRASVGGLLKYLGFTVLEAKDGRDAVEVFRLNRDRIAWVLMDLTMPGMDGHSAFLALRELDPNVTVILSSGWAEQDVQARFSRGAPAAVLPKPFSFELLETTLARLHLLPERSA